MRDVKCTYTPVGKDNELGVSIPSSSLTCQKCGHCVVSFGQRGRSVRRGLALMQAQCPNQENNQYTIVKKDDQDPN